MLATVAALVLLAAAPSDPAFESIVSGIANRSHEESCAQMDAWLTANPSAPDASRGLLWVARVRLLDGREDLARPLIERARLAGAGTRWEHAATKELADLDVAGHHWSEAIAGYSRLATSSDPYWSTLGKLAVRTASAERTRWYALWLLGVALAALVAIRLGLALRSGARLWPIPLEVPIGAPIALLFVLAALGKPPAQLQAVLSIALGGLALTWANAIVLRGRTLSAKRRIGEVLLAAGQAAALSFCAIVASGLWAKLMATLRLGGD
ncbi:MAG TPA: hypothetical protein VGK67_23425 [Myxococcales bacterium]